MNRRRGRVPGSVWLVLGKQTLRTGLFLGCAGAMAATALAEPPPQPPATQPAAVTAGDLVPLKARSGAFSIQLGKKPAQTVPFAFTDAGEGVWTYTLEDRSVARFRRGADGGLLVAKETDLDERVDVTYDPALCVLPPTLEPGKPFESLSKMVIRNSRDGSLKEKGTCAVRVELIGTQRIVTPAGEFTAVQVRETRQIRLRVAKADVNCDTWYVPGVGEVAEKSLTVTKALGIFGGKEVSESKLAR